MYAIVQCPQCPTKIKVQAKAGQATCPTCHHQFLPASEQGSMPAWISPWGLVAGIFAIMSLLSASLVGVRLLTQVLAALGLVVVLLGSAATKMKSTAQDGVWLILGGGACVLLLGLTFLAPALLNNRWALDVAAAKPDADKLIAVPRDLPRDPGKTLSAADWVNPAEEAIRQDDLFVCLESIKAGSFADKGLTGYAQVHLRFANLGGGMISFQGFDQHRPTLQDSSGASYEFLEQRERLRVGGQPVFDAPKWEGMDLMAAQAQSYLLVFDLPAKGINNLKLYIPAQAWGRNGMFQFKIIESF